MSLPSVQNGLLFACLAAVGAVAWALHLRAPLVVDPSPLAALPRDLGEWQSVDLPLDSAVESMLRADYNLQRAYTHPLGELIWFYLGYYGTERGGRPEHTPAVCYEAHGWKISSRRRIEAGSTSPLRVNEYVVERDGERRLVHFWFRSVHRTGLLGPLDQLTDLVTGRLLHGRADGSLVRVSARLDDDDAVTKRTRLLHFAIALDRQLEGYWPREAHAE